MHNLASEFGISLRGALVVMHDEEWGTIDGICEQFFGFIENISFNLIQSMGGLILCSECQEIKLNWDNDLF